MSLVEMWALLVPPYPIAEELRLEDVLSPRITTQRGPDEQMNIPHRHGRKKDGLSGRTVRCMEII